MSIQIRFSLLLSLFCASAWGNPVIKSINDLGDDHFAVEYELRMRPPRGSNMVIIDAGLVQQTVALAAGKACKSRTWESKSLEDLPSDSGNISSAYAWRLTVRCSDDLGSSSSTATPDDAHEFDYEFALATSSGSVKAKGTGIAFVYGASHEMRMYTSEGRRFLASILVDGTAVSARVRAPMGIGPESWGFRGEFIAVGWRKCNLRADLRSGTDQLLLTWRKGACQSR